jgi:LAGLIDADG endonuclease
MRKDGFSQPVRVRTLSPVEKAWLAGVIDGEGSIFISKVGAKSGYSRRGFFYKAFLSVANSNEDFVRRIREVIGMGYVGLTKERRRDWKDKWEYKGSPSVLRGILPQILPFLVVKQEVARKMLEYLDFIESNPIDGSMEIPEGYHEKLDSLYFGVKRLNEKGRDLPDDQLALASKPVNLNNRKPGNRAKACRRMSEPECAWLAGVLDGEGSILLSKVFNRLYRRGFFYRPQLEITNSNRSFLIRIAEVIGEGTVHRNKKGDETTKTRWAYIGSAGVLRAILPQLLPYMIVKKEQAKRMLEYFEFIDTHPLWGLRDVDPGYYGQLDSFYVVLKKLNKKGKQTSIRAN